MAEGLFGGGGGSVGDPFVVEDRADFEEMAEDPALYYIQGNDIDFGGTPFTPLGWVVGDTFSGEYDGDGHKITGLVISEVSGNAGLWKQLNDGAVFKNLTIVDAMVTGGAGYAGIISGSTQDATIENCRVSGIVSGGNNYVGALVGGTATGSSAPSIINCLAEVTVSSSSSADFIGGLIGGLGHGSIEFSGFRGTIDASPGSNFIGGLTGAFNTEASIQDSYAVGYMNAASADYASGIVGVGGSLSSSNASIVNCYSSLTWQGAGGMYTGGVISTEYVALTTITNTFYNKELMGRDVPGGEAKTSAEMLQEETYNAWDLETLWGRYPLENNLLPFLRSHHGNPTIINVESGTDLDEVRNDLSVWYWQKNDVSLSAFANWVPIIDFAGRYAGEGHKIENLNVDVLGKAGLFANVNGAELNGIVLDSPVVSSDDIVGALAGTVEDSSLFRCGAYDVSVTQGTADSVGGLVGVLEDKVIIRECFVRGGEVVAVNDGIPGGFLGSFGTGGTNFVVKDCYAVVNVTAGESGPPAGGFMAYKSVTGQIVMKNCYCAGAPTGWASWNGAFSGSGLANETIENLYYDSDLAGVHTDDFATGLTTEELKDAEILQASRRSFFLVHKMFSEAKDITWPEGIHWGAGGEPADPEPDEELVVEFRHILENDGSERWYAKEF